MTEMPLNHPGDGSLSLGQLGEAELANVCAHPWRLSGVLPADR